MAARRETTAVSAPRLSPAAPEELLRKAILARSPAARGRWARRGLAARSSLDKTTHAMLLRQLYLAHYELRRFERAQQIAIQALEVGVLVDVLHQDVARASLARGDVDRAVTHLRLASRRGPASRR
ncbi:MAG: tetratricopeptide repeat protein, partial [Myxococcota bacterium]|nr:tetratricopeptide repeat protein [Myxococcota bacterium]